MSRSKITEIHIQQGKEWMKAQAESGLNKETWCKENGIPRWKFFRLQRILRKQMLDQMKLNECSSVQEMLMEDPVFVELPVTSVTPHATSVTTATKSELDAATIATSVTKADNFTDLRTAALGYPASCHDKDTIRVSYGGFDVSVSNNADMMMLTSVLRAVANV